MPLIAYLQSGTLPNRKDAARKLKVQASRFVLIRDVLYKRGFSQPYLRCLSHDEADYVMREVHEGICENHLGVFSVQIDPSWVLLAHYAQGHLSLRQSLR